MQFINLTNIGYGNYGFKIVAGQPNSEKLTFAEGL